MRVTFILAGVMAVLAIPQVLGQSRVQGTLADTGGKVRIPSRASTSLFQGEQGKQRTEIHFDQATGAVTLKLLVQDTSGYFIPNLRRDNFVVYDNNVLQKDATVQVEHAPVSVGLLLEHGGRYPGLNKLVNDEVSRAGRQLLGELARDDKIAICRYADTVEQVSDFSQDHAALQRLFYTLEPPGISELNLYDAVIAVFQRMRSVSGRKAVVLVSSGVDTFSKAKVDDALRTAKESDTPLYAIGLANVLREATLLYGSTGPQPRIDWKQAESILQAVAQASGGRYYAPGTTLDLSATYDDIMENLKVRYVISYKPPIAGLNAPRTVRVELVTPDTGGPLQIMDTNGKTIHAHVVVQESYIPAKAANGKRS
jgi:Ca-activated chloride channel family protein